jgi:CheY-like chemotaxis protein
MARILLIDDDETFRDMVSQFLELDRHQVTEAADGVAGLKRFAEGAFDVVLTDILMPGMDGAQMILRIRERSPGQAIVAMSGGRRAISPEFNLQTAALAGATAQLAKPFSRVQLQAALSKALAAAGGKA